MTLVENLYKEDNGRLERLWNKYQLFHPGLRYLKQRKISKAVREGEEDYLIRDVEASFLHGCDNETVEREFVKAMNRGVDAVNNLCSDYLKECFDFRIENVPEAINLFELVSDSRAKMIEAHNRGKNRNPVPELWFEAYDAIRKIGLGYRVLKIDTASETLLALSHYEGVLDWFRNSMGFKDERLEKEQFAKSWMTDAGVRVYGDEVPMRSRLKILDPNGGLKYDSLLIKLFLDEGEQMDDIMDHTGIEFITSDDDARHKLEQHFRHRMIKGGNLERYKHKKRGNEGDNRHSANNFSFIKFVHRPPVEVSNHPLGSNARTRVPIEVQLYTLEDDLIRRKDPAVMHDNYRKTKFLEVFPVWFPRQIYAHLL
jgi:hypothetical protein